MTFKLGTDSLARLERVHPNLVRVVKRAITLTTQDFKVLEGVRTLERQRELYGQGRTAAQLAKVGLPAHLAKPGMKVVTWTLKSNHFAQADGFGRAVDLMPFPVDWNSLVKFDQIAKAMFDAAKVEGVTIRWGADWDRDGKPRERGETDSPHFELAV